MKKIFAAALALALFFNYLNAPAQTGNASIHDPRGSERRTASGQMWDGNQMVAAHKTYPLGSYVRILDPKTNKYVDVEIIDRGPYVRNRVIDISTLAAKRLGLPLTKGTLNVRVIKL